MRTDLGHQRAESSQAIRFHASAEALYQVYATGSDRATQPHDLAKHQASTPKRDLNRHALKFDAGTHTVPRLHSTASQVESNPAFRHYPIEKRMMERTGQRD